MGKLKVLIVDDHGVVRTGLRSLLEDQDDIEIVGEAASGEEGVEVAIKEKPDLILMDIQLPGIDGLEATKRIRASKADGEIPIIALTSYAMNGYKEKALAAGCTGYIEKPIVPETFIVEIEKYIK